MSNITVIKKPILAVLEDKKKLRDYEDTSLNALVLKLVIHLLDLLGVNDGKESHHTKLAEFIKAAYMHHTFEEIKHAFDLYVAGEFHLKPMQQLNAVVFGQVMRQFENYKRNRLEEYRRKKRLMSEKKETPTEEERNKILNNAVSRLYLEYKNTSKVSGVISHVYKYLYTQGKFPTHTKEYKKRILEKAKKIAKSEQSTLAMKDISIHRNLKKTIEKIESGNFDGLKTISMRVVLEEYFEEMANELKK